MTHQQKNNELQRIFKEKFDAHEKYKNNLRSSGTYEKARSQFQKANADLQQFLILFKQNNASPGDEFGAMGEKACQDKA